jgi:amino acid transporter
MFVITVTVLAKAHPKQSGKFVFTDFENFSGWENNVIAFITGFINANYSFSCLDAATHISEEIPHPEVNIPKALLTIPIIGLLSSLFYNISMVQFSVTEAKLDFLDLRLRHCGRDLNGKPSSRVILSSTTEYGRCYLLAMYVPLHGIFVSRQYSYMAISNGISPLTILTKDVVFLP